MSRVATASSNKVESKARRRLPASTPVASIKAQTASRSVSAPPLQPGDGGGGVGIAGVDEVGGGGAEPDVAVPQPVQRRFGGDVGNRLEEPIMGYGEDEHAIKFVEVALESHRRGNTSALTAGARAVQLIVSDD